MSKQTRTLSGKTAIVTGAAGGVGKATAKALARKGVKVALADLDRAPFGWSAAGQDEEPTEKSDVLP